MAWKRVTLVNWLYLLKEKETEVFLKFYTNKVDRLNYKYVAYPFMPFRCLKWGIIALGTDLCMSDNAFYGGPQKPIVTDYHN